MMANKHQETSQAASEERPEPSVSAAPEPEKTDREEQSEIAAETASEEEGSEIKRKADKDASRVAALESELASVKEELSSINDKYLRKLADDVNFRKRMVREKEEGQRFALSGLLGDLIPVLDDFDRAIGSSEIQKDYMVLHDGVSLIRRQLGSVLETKYGLVKVPALGAVFDPNRHEAVAIVQDATGEEATVAEEFLPGYCLHDRIIRTAKVKVRMPGPKEPEAAPDSKEAAPAADKQEN
jgi:molecular chaperone GrpE